MRNTDTAPSCIGNRGARLRRIGAVATAMFALLDEHERRVHVGPAPAATTDEIIAMLEAMLTAPVPQEPIAVATHTPSDTP